MSTFRCRINPYTFKSLTDRRVEFYVTFIYKLLNNVIDAPDLLAKLYLAVPPFYSRNPQTFKTNFHTTNCSYASSLDCACRSINYMSNIDILYDSLPSLILKFKNCTY